MDYKESHMPCAFEQTGLGMADGDSARSNSSTVTPVISLFKLKNFLHQQPKFKSLHSGDEQQQQQGVHSHPLQQQQQQHPLQQQPPPLQPQARVSARNAADNSQANCPLTHPVPSSIGSNIADENRSGSSGLDASSPMSHALYGGHGGRANTSPPVAHSQAMLVVPQPVKSAGGGHTNGTGRKYQCKMCPQVFGSKADMQLHTQIHMREAKPYKCSQCSKAFANSSYLSQHTRIHLGIKPYRCEICQRKFTQLSHLQQHIRTHTGDKPYKCRHPGCNKAFSQLSNLQSHSRCHQTDKPYKCNSCYKCFVDEASLLEHIPKHKESKHLKTHICQFCGKSYTQETYLAKHMQKHADRIDKRSALLGRTTHADAYGWPKAGGVAPVDCGPELQAHHHQSDHQHQQQQCAIPNNDPSRYASRQDMDRHAGQGLANNGRSSEEMLYNVEQKQASSASAFTPIQSSMLSSATARNAVAAAYFPYESFGFGIGGGGSMDMKSVEGKQTGHGHSFPNQLIALHQIRNYASMPGTGSSSLSEHPISGIKDKPQ